MKIDKQTKAELLKLYKEKNISLEGNILKIIETDGDEEFKEYIDSCLRKDQESRRKRLEITKQIQKQIIDSEKLRTEAEQAKISAELARDEAENAKITAQNDLELIQKKKQTELMGIITRVALGVIIGIGVITTVAFFFALASGLDTTLLGPTWSNIIGILLTNSFSIVGTIMGVRYATEKSDK